MKKPSFVLLTALAIGVVNTIFFKIFEWVVNNGTNFVWNDVFKSNVHRWVVIPLAIGLSLAFSGLCLLVGRKRIKPPQTDAFADTKVSPSITLDNLGITALIGAASLIAGASLGPEASLVMVSMGLGAWFAGKAKLGRAAELLVLASMGALLVVFVGSLVMVLLPLLLLAQKKHLSLASAAPVIVAGLAAFGTLWLINPNTPGYGTIPVPSHFTWTDLPLALGVGFCAAAFGWALKQVINYTAQLTKRLDTTQSWTVAAAVFGGVIGVLYLLGGETIQFSGSEGSHLLLHHLPAYGLGALLIILVTKLLVTGWSLAAGYQGGLVFPSVFSGVALALIAENLFSTTSPGVLLGGVAGIFAAMTGPIPALLFIVSLIPVKLVGTAVAGILGATLGEKLIARLSPSTA